MLAKTSYQYIQIGLALRFLRNVDETFEVGGVRSTIQMLEDKLEQSNFSVSLSATRAKSYKAVTRQLKALDSSAKLGSPLDDEITDQFITLESVVFAEAGTKKLYVLPDRRFNTDYLLNQPEKLLKDGSFAKLNEIARTDISSSCRCLLFGEATASAFHILRATEAVLKTYYFHHRRQKRLDKPMWGPMVEQLKAKTRNKPPSTLIQSLDLIRTAYRNPTQHPEAIYQIDSAQDLFGVCLDAIGKMAEEL